jgi:hypothetical protein
MMRGQQTLFDAGVIVIYNYNGYFGEDAGKGMASGLLRLSLVFTFSHEAVFDIITSINL